MKIPISSILPNPEQPRQHFDQAGLQSLADSIRKHGLLNPISVQPAGDGQYILLDGERRLRAHQLLGAKEIEASLSETGAASAARLVSALVANLQRADLSPLEQAHAFQRLRQMGLSNASIAHQLSISSATVVSRLKLLDLDKEIQDLIQYNFLPVDPRATDALLSIRQPKERVKIAQKLARPGITIKTIVKACHTYNQVLKQRSQAGTNTPLHIPAIELAKDDTPNAQQDWDIIAQSGVLPPWDLLVASARASCDKCGLRRFASALTCKDCPAIDLIRTMMEKCKC